MSYRGPTQPQGFEDASGKLNIWRVSYERNQWLVYCNVCRSTGQTPYNANSHKKTAKHLANVARLRSSQSQTPTTSATSDTTSMSRVPPAVPITSVADLAATRLMQSLAHSDSLVKEPLPPLSYFAESPLSAEPNSQFDWGDLDVLEPEFSSGSHDSEGIQALNDFMLNIYQFGPDNINSDDEHLSNVDHLPTDSDNDSGDDFEPSTRGPDAFNPYDGLLNKRSRNDFSHKSPEWFPWSNRTLDLFLWLLKVNGTTDATSVKTMKDLDSKLQSLYGIQTYEYKGAFGHTYYVNSIADIISQEMSNPRVRPHLSFYPEDKPNNLSEANQFAHWCDEIADNELGPMVRIGSDDYYIFEPAMLRSGVVCMPHRWLIREGRFYARCWRLEEIVREGNRKSWRVIQGDSKFEVDQEDFLKPFPKLMSDMYLYPHLTNVSVIEDVINKSTEPPTIFDWKHMNPVLGNPWRHKANGAMCLSFPIWLYCDDTSGNTSKRWNEHNSFLFTPAGLPRSEISKEYNVHFLCTSNSAPPLEMLDGIVDQINDAQEHGIWAWDLATESVVLLLVSVFALLGDNPMQSEFACHIGLRGKFFCRTCWVKGKDAAADRIQQATASSQVDSDSGSSGDGSEANSVQSGSTAASKGGTKKKPTKYKESLASMVARVKAFVKPGKPRHKTESIEALKNQLTEAQTSGAQSRISKSRTDTGLKDTYQNFFINRLLNSYKRHRGGCSLNQENTVNDTCHALPEETMSPVWRIRGLDPHSDTPVEILHVVLLGFIKYLWRDVIENQIKKNPEKKAELAARLSSVDVEGLGLGSKLPGETLVNYYGSLTGSNFRKICQVAPFVLKPFVADQCYETWISLSKLVPLIWQPMIENLDEYLVTLQHEIDQFLLRVAKWNKFLNPSMQSSGQRVYIQSSNRLAPSRDIAWAFGKQNRIRHLLSGGIFLDREQIELNGDIDKKFVDSSLHQRDRITQVQHYFRSSMFEQKHWVSVGQSALDVVSYSDTVAQYLGISDKKKELPQTGTCVLDQTAGEQHWWNTQSGRLHTPSSNIFTDAEKSLGSFHRSKDLIVNNGDQCSVHTFVTCSDPLLHNFAHDRLAVVEVVEILRLKRTNSSVNIIADSVLVEAMSVGSTPSCHGEYFLVKPEMIQCTVNVQHDCDHNNCQLERIAPVYQERKKTSQLKAVIVHKGDLSDRVLNTAQMRDAKFVQKFRIMSDNLALDHVLEHSATREWDSVNKAKVSHTQLTGYTSRRTGKAPSRTHPSPVIHTTHHNSPSPSMIARSTVPDPVQLPYAVRVPAQHRTPVHESHPSPVVHTTYHNSPSPSFTARSTVPNPVQPPHRVRRECLLNIIHLFMSSLYH
ncbi:hypothetical protein F5878DRAFT_706070 [Lentinula raphanica]|uniref:Uncharacterized protein n=1 Tax=Lentinula raphanica TaxID=153919 RepID=A0AA38PKJ9_9AGAR|nr:hypothetical protein F5878DRAFT_706070 [Lentinula raphanica]